MFKEFYEPGENTQPPQRNLEGILAAIEGIKKSALSENMPPTIRAVRLGALVKLVKEALAADPENTLLKIDLAEAQTAEHDINKRLNNTIDAPTPLGDNISMEKIQQLEQPVDVPAQPELTGIDAELLRLTNAAAAFEKDVAHMKKTGTHPLTGAPVSVKEIERQEARLTEINNKKIGLLDEKFATAKPPVQPKAIEDISTAREGMGIPGAAMEGDNAVRLTRTKLPPNREVL